MQLSPEITNIFPESAFSFDRMMKLTGIVYRELENRKTQKIMLDGHTYFIKQHFGVGWKEISKNIFQFRLPVCSAKNEWLAIQKLEKLNINVPKIVGFGCRGSNPAKLESFLITEELPTQISLEDLAKKWQKNQPPVRLKWDLIAELAYIARVLHENGINHRDFYLCHFLLSFSANHNSTKNNKSFLSKTPTYHYKIFLIDLHRAQIREKTPRRWQIKDLAGLYFSSQDMCLTKRDILRFIKEYRNKKLQDILSTEDKFWQKVKKRGDKLYQKHNR